MEGQPLRITVAGDPSVRVFGVLAPYPLPDARPVAPNQFEMLIPKTVPPGRYNLTAVGLASGGLVPGGRVRLMGSGFGSEQERGYVAVGDAKAEVVSWNSTEIILIVPESVIPGRIYKVSVHQSGRSQEFPMLSFRE